MFLTDFRTRKYTGGIISRVGIFLTVTPHNFMMAVRKTFNTNNLVSFNPETYTRCAYESGQLLLEETRQIDCDTSVTGRYVAVYIYQTVYLHLTITELQVFGEPAPGKSLLRFSFFHYGLIKLFYALKTLWY